MTKNTDVDGRKLKFDKISPLVKSLKLSTFVELNKQYNSACELKSLKKIIG